MRPLPGSLATICFDLTPAGRRPRTKKGWWSDRLTTSKAIFGPGGILPTFPIGLKAAQTQYKVLFTSAVAVVTQLLAAEEKGSLAQTLHRLAQPDLLIIDEVGYIPFARPAANLFFQIVNRRYEAGSIILTSNRAFSSWGEIFGGDVVVAAAMIDRLVHHAEVISLSGNSYRLKDQEKLTAAAYADKKMSSPP